MCDTKSVNNKIKKLKKLTGIQKKSIFFKSKKRVDKTKNLLINLIVNEVGVSFKDAAYEVERSIICADMSSKIIKKIVKNYHSNF